MGGTTLPMLAIGPTWSPLNSHSTPVVSPRVTLPQTRVAAFWKSAASPSLYFASATRPLLFDVGRIGLCVRSSYLPVRFQSTNPSRLAGWHFGQK